jgi:hypothetical protein
MWYRYKLQHLVYLHYFLNVWPLLTTRPNHITAAFALLNSWYKRRKSEAKVLQNTSLIQHAKQMRQITLSSVACPAVPYFCTLCHKRHYSVKKLLKIKIVFWFSLQRYIWNISYLEKKSTRYYHKITQVFMQSNCFSCQILMKLQLSGPILDKYNTSHLMNIRPVGDEFSLRTDIQLHLQNLIDSFAIFQTRVIKRIS